MSQIQYFCSQYQKLYLNPELADVYFICDDNSRVPAHNLLLSTISEGFKTLFDEANFGQSDFTLSNVRPGALKTFLQFFYLPKIELIFEHMGDVIYLARKFGTDDILRCCNDFLEKKLTPGNIIVEYEQVVECEHSRMKTICEQKIAIIASDVLKSEKFLECKWVVLRHLLRIDSLMCDESDLLAALVAWAESSAKRKNLNTADTRNLRGQLGELMYSIRFKSINMGKFAEIIRPFDGLFKSSELEEIIKLIHCKDYMSNVFNNKTRGSNPVAEVFSLECNRYEAQMRSRYYVRKVERTQFETNTSTLLVGFTVARLNNLRQIKTNEIVDISLPSKWTINEHGTQISTLFVGDFIMTSERNTVVTLRNPINIQPYRKYEIRMEQATSLKHFNQIQLKHFVEMRHGLKVRFIADINSRFNDTKFGVVMQLQFLST